jgi:glycosyltransferase involved in cell wall biosynthesis
MKIAQVHNYYQQAGGEDGVVAAERELLRSHGHEVVTYYRNNSSISGRWQLVLSGFKTLWNWEVYRGFRRFLREERPDVVHSHNTFPLISPALHWACAKEGVPIVQTLHNYRLLCLSAFLFREGASGDGSGCAVESRSGGGHAKGAVCELCLKRRFKWPGIRYRCYRGSRAGSGVAALMLLVHRILGTWTNKVNAYIALTEFQKRKLVEGGFPAEKISVKPNFIAEDPACQGTASGVRVSAVRNKPYALFVGRLSPEKGCDVLVRGWGLFRERMADSGAGGDSEVELLIVGDGPERSELEILAASRGGEGIRFQGRKEREEVLELMRNARFVVLPSVWYEGFPMTIVESFSCGTPVVATDDGGMQEIIGEQWNGLKFAMGDAASLAGKLEWAFKNADKMEKMGVKARQDFESKYSADANYGALMQIYGEVLDGRA